MMNNEDFIKLNEKIRFECSGGKNKVRKKHKTKIALFTNWKYFSRFSLFFRANVFYIKNSLLPPPSTVPWAFCVTNGSCNSTPGEKLQRYKNYLVKHSNSSRINFFHSIDFVYSDFFVSHRTSCPSSKRANFISFLPIYKLSIFKSFISIQDEALILGDRPKILQWTYQRRF